MMRSNDIRPGQLWLYREPKNGEFYLIVKKEGYRRWLVLHSTMGWQVFGEANGSDTLLEDVK